MRATRLANFMQFDFITLIIFGKGYKLRSSSLCNFFRPSVTSSFLGPNILLSTVLKDTESVYFFFILIFKFREETDMVTLNFKIILRLI
jgi:hypothetical protein